MPPYDRMIQTSIATWNSVEVEGIETIFYCSTKDSKYHTHGIMYFDVANDLHSMGHKNLAMFEWALENKSFDYVARVNASCYVDKKQLIKYVQTLPETNLIAGAVADSQNGFPYLWGGAQYIISRDVVQKIVDNKAQWQHKYMEDEAMSLLVNWLSIPYTAGYSGSIDNMGDHWRCISYGGEAITFTDFSDLVPLGHHYYRVKQDGRRWLDQIVMKNLFRVLNPQQ